MDGKVEDEQGEHFSLVRIAGDKAKWGINCFKFIQNKMSRKIE